MQKEQTKIEQLAEEVLILSCNTLLVHLRFLDMALNQLKLQSTDSSTIMTDGRFVFYEPKHILTEFKKQRESIAHDYLHMVLHCVYRHMFVGVQVDRTLWNLACDIAVENIITEFGLKCVSADRKQRQRAHIVELKKELKILTAEKIYNHLKISDYPSFQLSTMANDFRADDHTIWYKAKDCEPTNNDREGSSRSDTNEGNNKEVKNGKTGEKEDFSQSTQSNEEQKSDKAKDGELNNNIRGEFSDNDKTNNKESTSQLSDGEKDNVESDAIPNTVLEAEWQKIAERMQGEVEAFVKNQGNEFGSLMQNLKSVNREKYDYTSFLKKFAVTGEVMKINDDEFDYVFYTYGLKLYDKMPLIEPLEYKETKRIKEFVLAIDTSGSTSGELVQKFVQKTYNVLKSTESFFSKVNLHIIQCDTKVQEHVKITSQEEFDEYMKTMKIHGLGGTDFRPVFELTDKLIKQKEFLHLKGLIYFTDGYGTFPAKKPSYESAFVFLEDGYNNYEVPSWAIKLVLKSEEI